MYTLSAGEVFLQLAAPCLHPQMQPFPWLAVVMFLLLLRLLLLLLFPLLLLVLLLLLLHSLLLALLPLPLPSTLPDLLLIGRKLNGQCDATLQREPWSHSRHDIALANFAAVSECTEESVYALKNEHSSREHPQWPSLPDCCCCHRIE